MTVAELRRALEGVPDDAEVLVQVYPDGRTDHEDVEAEDVQIYVALSAHVEDVEMEAEDGAEGWVAEFLIDAVPERED